VAVEIKVCGITRPVDAELAVGLGVARLGVVFAWGPRVVDRRRAAEIVAAAGEVPVLGVVSGGTVDEYLALAESVGLAGLQLHGESAAPLARTLQREGLEVWRVASVASKGSSAISVANSTDGADLVLLEPAVLGRSGGRGIPLDRDLARAARDLLAGHRVGLAGGLTAATVGETIRIVGPDLVDVSSGVESAPGIKARERLIDFVEAVRDARTTR
jgi:phosphoribosylanthranilate isomerase